MSVETPQPLPLSERMKRCPIHAVVDVEAVLHVSKVLSIYVP
ncbi:MAG TPA: hypothetical protein VFG51_03465 [Candidatus Saccharimonadia bacterium]|nr:hypothetical protein [Candidatus Saccharimonadia bacterium]